MRRLAALRSTPPRFLRLLRNVRRSRASTPPARAGRCLRSQPTKEADKEKTCRAYATVFYEALTLRRVATTCTAGERNLPVLDPEINAFNNLMATKCGG